MRACYGPGCMVDLPGSDEGLLGSWMCDESAGQ